MNSQGTPIQVYYPESRFSIHDSAAAVPLRRAGQICPVNDQGDLSTQIVQPLSISNGGAWRCFQKRSVAGLVPVNDQGIAHTA